MLRGLLGGKFSNKCKHGVKCIRMRLVPIRNRKQSMIRILRKDVADLLTAGHDRDAFLRIDVLMAEINHRACYDMIEKFCEFLLSQLPSMQKQRECPQEVTETMATLIFAAARFADLPELCALRILFIQRYGSDMQSFVNAEFIDKIQTKTFPIEKKLQLMKDIADEFSVKWDSSSFNHELTSSPALKFNQSKESMSSKVDVRHTPAMLYEPKEISSREGLHFTTADAARQQQTLMPNDAHVFSAAKINQIYDPKMRTRKVTAYESVTMDIYEEDLVHDDVNSSSNHVRKHDDGKPKSGTCHGRKPEVENEKQYCIDSEVQRVGTLKSLNDEPDNLVPPYTKSNGNKSGYNRIEGTALPPSYTKVDGPKNAFPVIKRSPSNLESSRQMSVEEGLDLVGEDLKQVRSEKKGLLANMDPPYVKLKDRGTPAHIDPLILNSDSVDHMSSNETGARCNGNEDNERPKPFSVKKNFHSRPTIETDNNLEKPNQDASTDGRWRNKSNRRTSGYGNNANFDEDNATTSKASKSPIRGEMADVLDCGRPLPRTSSVERRHGNKSSAVMHDRMENDENSYGKHDTHPSGVGRNHRSKQGNEAYAGIFNEERITGSNGSKQPMEDGLDNAIDYGNLFRRTSHGQRAHRSIRHPAAVHHVEYEHDEQEMAKDRLLTHLSRKGTTKVHVKDRRTRIVAGNSTEHQGEVLHVDRRDSVSALERTRSMQPERVGVSASKPFTRAASMQSDLSNPNYGRVHQRRPDYDQMVARFTAFRQSWQSSKRRIMLHIPCQSISSSIS